MLLSANTKKMKNQKTLTCSRICQTIYCILSGDKNDKKIEKGMKYNKHSSTIKTCMPPMHTFQKCFGLSFISEGRMQWEINRRIGAASAVMRTLYRSVVGKKGLSSLRDRVRSLVIQEGLRIKPRLVCIERSQRHLVRMPPGHLPVEVFWGIALGGDTGENTGLAVKTLWALLWQIRPKNWCNFIFVPAKSSLACLGSCCT